MIPAAAVQGSLAPVRVGVDRTQDAEPTIIRGRVVGLVLGRAATVVPEIDAGILVDENPVPRVAVNGIRRDIGLRSPDDPHPIASIVPDEVFHNPGAGGSRDHDSAITVELDRIGAGKSSRGAGLKDLLFGVVCCLGSPTLCLGTFKTFLPEKRVSIPFAALGAGSFLRRIICN